MIIIFIPTVLPTPDLVTDKVSKCEGHYIRYELSEKGYQYRRRDKETMTEKFSPVV